MDATTLAVSALLRRRRVLVLGLMAFVGFLVAIATVVTMVLLVVFGGTAALCGDDSGSTGSGADDPANLTTVAIAKPIYAVGQDMRVSDKLVVSAFITGMVESGGGIEMNNLPCEHPGDCDGSSVGVFQQQDMAPWNRRNRHNVSDAARSYFEVALATDQPAYSAGQLSYAVQRPDAAYQFRYLAPDVHARAIALLEQVKTEGAGASGDDVDAPASRGDGKGSSDPSQMAWPTEVHTITSPFGAREAPCLGCSTYHQGLDIGAAEGDPVHAVLNGRVTFRGEMSGYGNYVCLTHSAKLTTCYGHLSRFGRWQVNDTITRGAVIGYVGQTGNVNAPHLHFEVRLGADVTAPLVDPAPYLKGAGDAPAGGGEVDTDADAGCGDQTTGGGVADLTSADVVREPRRMEALPKWATADGYPRPAVADARIIPSLLYLLRHYNVRVHDCLASGHNTHGSGDSCDIVPADDPLPVPGRITPGWANVTQLARDLGWQPPGPGYAGGYSCSSGAPFVPAIYIVCYDGDVNHGDPDHITGSCACPHLHITFENPVHAAPVALDTPPEWVKVFPIEQTDDGSAPSVQMVGDSLAVGTQDALPGQLDGYQVATNAKEGRTLTEGMQILSGLAGKPSILALSLFTNDDPRQVDELADAVRASTQAVKANGCVVWATIHRPPVGGVSYDKANAKLRAIAADNPQVQVVEWDAAADEHPGWFDADGVHPSPDGYQARARLYAQAIRRCAP
jgi:murein DD-endopeptidase MepM/ murein hydrolase activator NlpD